MKTIKLINTTAATENDLYKVIGEAESEIKALGYLDESLELLQDVTGEVGNFTITLQVSKADTEIIPILEKIGQPFKGAKYFDDEDDGDHDLDDSPSAVNNTSETQVVTNLLPEVAISQAVLKKEDGYPEIIAQGPGTIESLYEQSKAISEGRDGKERYFDSTSKKIYDRLSGEFLPIKFEDQNKAFKILKSKGYSEGFLTANPNGGLVILLGYNGVVAYGLSYLEDTWRHDNWKISPSNSSGSPRTIFDSVDIKHQYGTNDSWNDFGVGGNYKDVRLALGELDGPGYDYFENKLEYSYFNDNGDETDYEKIDCLKGTEYFNATETVSGTALVPISLFDNGQHADKLHDILEDLVNKEAITISNNDGLISLQIKEMYVDDKSIEGLAKIVQRLEVLGKVSFFGLNTQTKCYDVQFEKGTKQEEFFDDSRLVHIWLPNKLDIEPPYIIAQGLKTQSDADTSFPAKGGKHFVVTPSEALNALYEFDQNASKDFPSLVDELTKLGGSSKFFDSGTPQVVVEFTLLEDLYMTKYPEGDDKNRYWSISAQVGKKWGFLGKGLTLSNERIYLQTDKTLLGSYDVVNEEPSKADFGLKEIELLASEGSLVIKKRAPLNKALVYELTGDSDPKLIDGADCVKYFDANYEASEKWNSSNSNDRKTFLNSIGIEPQDAIKYFNENYIDLPTEIKKRLVESWIDSKFFSAPDMSEGLDEVDQFLLDLLEEKDIHISDLEGEETTILIGPLGYITLDKGSNSLLDNFGDLIDIDYARVIQRIAERGLNNKNIVYGYQFRDRLIKLARVGSGKSKFSRRPAKGQEWFSAGDHSRDADAIIGCLRNHLRDEIQGVIELSKRKSPDESEITIATSQAKFLVTVTKIGPALKEFSADTDLSEAQLGKTLDELISDIDASDHENKALFKSSVEHYKTRYPEAKTVKEVIDNLEEFSDSEDAKESSKFRMFLGGFKGITKNFSAQFKSAEQFYGKLSSILALKAKYNSQEEADRDPKDLLSEFKDFNLSLFHDCLDYYFNASDGYENSFEVLVTPRYEQYFDANFPAQYGIDTCVQFVPTAKQQECEKIVADLRYGVITGVKFTKAKVLYDVLDDAKGIIFESIPSENVTETPQVVDEPAPVLDEIPQEVIEPVKAEVEDLQMEIDPRSIPILETFSNGTPRKMIFKQTPKLLIPKK